MSDMPKHSVLLVTALVLVLTFPLVVAGQESALDHFVSGVEFFDEPDYEAATQSFRQAVELEPGNLEYQYYLGLSLKAQGLFKEALAVFTGVVEQDPVEFNNGFFEMADIHKQNKVYIQALQVLDDAAQAAPTKARVYMEKGFVHQALGEYEQAIANFNKAGEMDPELMQAVYYNIAAVYFEQRHFELARQTFEKSIAVDPQSPAAANARKSIDNLATAKKAQRKFYFSTTLG